MSRSTLLTSRLREIAIRAGVELDEGQIGQLEEYLAILARWNSRINLTGLPLDGYPAAALDRLVGESIRVSALVPADVKVWFDLGSGGGSPAIPLKVVRPEIALRMVESRFRKAAFLREAIISVGFRETVVICDRVENIASSFALSADLVTVRAVKLSDELTAAIDTLLSERGVLLIFGSPDTSAVLRRFSVAQQQAPDVVVFNRGVRAS